MYDKDQTRPVSGSAEKGQAASEAWLDGMMACYDAVEWQVAKECPELVAWEGDPVSTEAIMRYYNE